VAAIGADMRIKHRAKRGLRHANDRAGSTVMAPLVGPIGPCLVGYTVFDVLRPALASAVPSMVVGPMSGRRGGVDAGAVPSSCSPML